MPIFFQFSDNTICITLSGQYSIEDGKQVYQAILKDPRFREGMNLLFDANQSAANPGLDEIRDRVAFLKSVVGHTSGRIAVVVSDTLRYGLVRMISIYGEMEGLNIQAFKELEKAQLWLESESEQSSSAS